MRIPGRKVYRAFKELDQFPDERCVRFVAVANRGWVRVVVSAMLMLVVGVIVLFLSLALLMLTAGDMDRKLGFGYEYYLLMIPIWVIGLSAGPLAALVTRDVILKRRVRRIIKLRSKCVECGYSLIGLPVRDDLAVVCSECGAETVVDRAFGELVLDEQGRARFDPKEGGLGEVRVAPAMVLQKEEKIKGRSRFVRRAALTLVLLVVGAIGMSEFLIWKDAMNARQEALALKHYWKWLVNNGAQLGKSGGIGNGWDVVTAVAERYRDLKPTMFVNERGEQEDPRWYVWEWPTPEWESRWGAGDPVMAAYRMKEWQQDRKRYASGRALLQELEEAGFFAELDAVSLDGTFRIALPVGKDELLSLKDFAVVDEAIRLGRACLARMSRSTQTRDLAGFVRASRGAFVIATALRCVPTLRAAQASVSMQSRFYRECAEWIACCPSAHEIETLADFVVKLPPVQSLAFACNGERMRSADAVGSVFRDASNVRWGIDTKRLAMRQTLQNAPASLSRWEIGSYHQNREMMDIAWVNMEWFAKEEYWRRQPSGYPWRETPLVDLLFEEPGQAIFERTLAELRRRSVVQALGIERFRLAQGRYPFADEFEKGETGPVQQDVFSGRPLRYIEFRPGEISLGASLNGHRGLLRLLDSGGYLLLSAGPDKAFDVDTRRVFLALDELWMSNTPGLDAVLTPLSECR